MLLQQKLGGGGKLKKWDNIDQVIILDKKMMDPDQSGSNKNYNF
jgi:hypothetical protein